MEPEATVKRMFDGYRVLELGTWVLVLAAATVLADFGADVVKIEHPRDNGYVTEVDHPAGAG
jgi:crotonobetainyl-CoA:carnitine CoA-transferase CaiB-like acyl-CoA transferase